MRYLGIFFLSVRKMAKNMPGHGKKKIPQTLRNIVKSVASLPSAKFIGFVVFLIPWRLAENESFTDHHSCGVKVVF